MSVSDISDELKLAIRISFIDEDSSVKRAYNKK
jgi:hypothetical protein